MLTVGLDGSVIVGAPTGGAKGYGTLNAQAVYDDNTLLTDYVFDMYYDQELRTEDLERYASYVPLNLEETIAFTKDNRHLPTITGRDDYIKQGGISLGKLATELWASVETNFLFISELNSRLKSLEQMTADNEQLTLQGAFQANQQLSANIDSLTVQTLVVKNNLIVEGFAQFNNDTAGRAIIPAGAVSVFVNFIRDYPAEPVVTVTMRGSEALNQNFRYAVMDEARNGFRIMIDKPQTQDIQFSWHAVSLYEPIRLIVGTSAETNSGVVAGESAGPADEGQQTTDGSISLTTSNQQPTEEQQLTTGNSSPTANERDGNTEETSGNSEDGNTEEINPSDETSGNTFEEETSGNSETVDGSEDGSPIESGMTTDEEQPTASNQQQSTEEEQLTAEEEQPTIDTSASLPTGQAGSPQDGSTTE